MQTPATVLATAHPNGLDMVKRKSAVSAEAAPAPTPFAEVGADSPPPALQPQPVSHLSDALLYASFLQHYISTASLQLAGIAFTIYFCSTSNNIDSSSPSPSFLSSLISAPIPTLSRLCIGVSLVQAWFGTFARSSRRNALGLAGKGKVGNANKRGFLGALKDIKDSALGGKALARPEVGATPIDTSYLLPVLGVTLAGTAVFYASAVLLGAPLFSSITETFLLSLLLSLLCVTPLAFAIPYTEHVVYRRLVASFTPKSNLEYALLSPAFGAIVGSWLAAVLIPLDWDRPWQIYPTTCVFGALGGHAVGTLAGLTSACLRSYAN